MIVSLLTTIPAILLFALSRSFIQILVACVLLAATGIYYAPAYEALQADFAPRLMRGRITAVWDISSAISAALGAFIGGFTFQTIGPAVPLYVFAVAELGALLLLVAWVREPQVRET
jgi:predicted MFS family arabinose efflux permease